MNICQATKKFMLAFAQDENGMNADLYDQFYNLVHTVFGMAGTIILSKYVDATDSNFYVSEDKLKYFHNEMNKLPD